MGGKTDFGFYNSSMLVIFYIARLCNKWTPVYHELYHLKKRNTICSLMRPPRQRIFSLSEAFFTTFLLNPPYTPYSPQFSPLLPTKYFTTNRFQTKLSNPFNLPEWAIIQPSLARPRKWTHAKVEINFQLFPPCLRVSNWLGNALAQVLTRARPWVTNPSLKSW